MQQSLLHNNVLTNMILTYLQQLSSFTQAVNRFEAVSATQMSIPKLRQHCGCIKKITWIDTHH